MSFDVAQSPTLAGLSPVPAADRVRVAVNRLLRSRGIWALGDQGVLSLGNFFTNILLANHLSKTLYGVYVLVFGVVLFLNSLHGSIVTYPLTVRGAACDAVDLRRLVGRSLTLTMLLGPILGLGILYATGATGRWTLLPLAIAALLLWQAQETLRRALMAQFKYAWAIPGDAISYLGQAAAVWGLYKLGRLTPETAFTAIAVTSGLAAIVQAIQLRALPSGTWSSLRPLAADCWRLGRWLLLTNLLTVATVYLTPWVLRYARGLGEVAMYGALATVMGVVNPIFAGMGGLIVPAVAAAEKRSGRAAAGRAGLRYALQGSALLVPIFVVLAIFPGFALRTFFPSQPAYHPLTSQLRLLVLVYVLYFAGQVCLHVLSGLERSRDAFVATLFGAGGSLLLTTPLTLVWGLNGALWGGVLPTLVQLIVSAVLLRRAFSRRAAGPAVSIAAGEDRAPAVPA